ncbi:BatD family protein [Pseudomonas sp. M30-35]|uniref:BatD family protein n=1 Tax=Pseudomonas sp. M30-35 TaxID=1981174 RepID=UPI000B3CA315|nr:BatD family protein [Pseudomonas sp. M30-35]ARU87601.1 hypothetical protein B9K09_06320 [Pseudomonas sp. M30-35]
MKHLILLLTLLLPLSVWAAEPTLLVDSRLTPKNQVLVGGIVTLEVDLLVDTWFTSAPQLPKLELPGAVVSAPSSQATHLTQKRDGKTFFGLRFTYRITPQQAQTFDIPALSVQVQPGQGSKPQTVQTQAQKFSAVQPVGANDQEHVLVAEQVTYTQTIVRSHKPLRVGDSISRQLSVRAKGAQAMLIPAPELAEVNGLKQYVQTPNIQPMDNGRGDITGGIRTDTITYVVSEQGNYTLPAIELKWWDQAGQPQIASIPKVTFKAQGESGYSGPFSISEDLRQLGQNTQLHIARHWLLLSALILLAALIGYFGRTYWNRGLQLFLQRRAARQQAWRDSPDFAWQQLQARLNDQTLAASELYRWVKRSADADTLQGASKNLPSHLRNQLLILLKASYSANKTALARASAQKQTLTKLRELFKHSRTAPPAVGTLKPLNPKH